LAKKTIPQTGKALSAFLARVADNKLATDITVMDLQKIESAPAAYFVICTCDSEPQLKAVVDSVDEACIKVGIKKARKEGYGTSHWVLLDFFDVIFHIMMKDARSLYKIEKLWSDAVFFDLSDKGRLKKSK
jgi:ribosome-associated protein